MRMTPGTPTDIRGLRLILGPPSLAAIEEVHERVMDRLLAAVDTLKGPSAAARLRARGLDRLHEVIGPGDIGPLRDQVLEPLRMDLLGLAVEVGRRALGWPQDFFIDDYLILRINFPFALARSASTEAENPGVGRVSPGVRALAVERRVKDPVYDPAGYHRDCPPAAWAHGPHLDSWTGHSQGGVNLWWAIVDVPAEAGMVLYPQAKVGRADCDPQTLYLRRGVALPPPTPAPLRAGEMLVFDPEVLHGTHLNVSDRTRVAVSMRLNASAPRFDPDCFYAREFWRRASDIEAGRQDAVLHFKREEHLADAAASSARSPGIEPPTASEAAAQGHAMSALNALSEGGHQLVVTTAGKLIVWRSGGRLYATDAACPHYGLDLADGGVADGKVYCPGCAVGFDLETGRSASDSLRLATHQIEERDGQIVIAGAPLVD